MFSIYQNIFGLKFERVDAPYKWVADLQLYAVSDSMTGEPLFTAEAIVILPTGLTTDELRTELERIGNDVMVDLALTESDNAKAD